MLCWEVFILAEWAWIIYYYRGVFSTINAVTAAIATTNAKSTSTAASVAAIGSTAYPTAATKRLDDLNYEPTNKVLLVVKPSYYFIAKY